MATRRVLFAIRNPDAPRQPGLAKAIQVARALDATLELFHALTDSIVVEFARFENGSLDRLRERVEAEARVPLARLCTRARRHGVPATSRVDWDYPAHEAIVRRAQNIGADLIVAECHRGVRTQPWLIHLTDWELLRTSPLPVLLLRNGKPWRRPVVLAAVDPTHAHAKSDELDTRILAAARHLGEQLRGELHVTHATNPPLLSALRGFTPGARETEWSGLTVSQWQEQARRAFHALSTEEGIAAARAHLVAGDPVSAIPRLARQLDAGLVVMGAVARSGLQRVFIGNTAERVLDALPCDVLVVKPERFPSAVGDRVRSERMEAPAASLAFT